MSQADRVSGVRSESISKMKNGEAARLSGVVLEMVKAAGEAQVDIINHLVNQVTVELFL